MGCSKKLAGKCPWTTKSGDRKVRSLVDGGVLPLARCLQARSDRSRQGRMEGSDDRS